MPEKRGTHTAVDSPHSVGAAITPDDNNDLAAFTWGIYVGGTVGNLKVDLVNGGTVIFNNLAVGVVHPLRVKRVYSTLTTSTNIVGLY